MNTHAGYGSCCKPCARRPFRCTFYITANPRPVSLRKKRVNAIRVKTDHYTVRKDVMHVISAYQQVTITSASSSVSCLRPCSEITTGRAPSTPLSVRRQLPSLPHASARLVRSLAPISFIKGLGSPVLTRIRKQD